MLLILASSGLVIFFTVGIAIDSLVRSRDDYMIVINWCKEVMEGDGPIFVKARLACIRIVKINIVVCYYLGFSCTVLPAILGLFIAPGEFAPPLPFVLPYLNPKTWIAFVLDTFAQSSALFVYDTLGGILFSVFGIHYYASVAFVDDLVEKIQEIGREILEKERQNKQVTRNKMKKHKGNLNVRNVVNSNKDFSKRVQEVVDRYCVATE